MLGAEQRMLFFGKEIGGADFGGFLLEYGVRIGCGFTDDARYGGFNYAGFLTC